MPYKPTGKRAGRPKKTPTKTPTVVITDPASVDPRAILAEIAQDADAPAGARVQAARTLLLNPRKPGDDDQPMDELTRRALAILNQTGRLN